MQSIFGNIGSIPGKSVRSIFEFRKRVFVDELGWDIPVVDNMESDEFDHQDTLYLAHFDRGEVTGVARLLPTTGPYLLQSVFADLLAGLPVPSSSRVWELSRFATRMPSSEASRAAASSYSAGQMSSAQARDLLDDVIRRCAALGVEALVTVSPLGIERMLQSAGFAFSRIARPRRHGRHLLVPLVIDVQASRGSRAEVLSTERFDGAVASERPRMPAQQL